MAASPEEVDSRELRNKAGKTQRALAEASGLAQDSIRQFESGRRELAYETLEKLA
jgi:transcriptional regulator with XRE-family HTH domain